MGIIQGSGGKCQLPRPSPNSEHLLIHFRLGKSVVRTRNLYPYTYSSWFGWSSIYSKYEMQDSKKRYKFQGWLKYNVKICRRDLTCRRVLMYITHWNSWDWHGSWKNIVKNRKSLRDTGVWITTSSNSPDQSSQVLSVVCQGGCTGQDRGQWIWVLPGFISILSTENHFGHSLHTSELFYDQHCFNTLCLVLALST